MDANPSIDVDDAGDEAPPPLPELLQGEFDADGRNRYFEDLAQCADVREVTVRHRPGERVDGAGRVTLGQAREWVLGGRVTGMQVRYEYDGAEWLDTLLVRGEGGRLVRMRVSGEGENEAKNG